MFKFKTFIMLISILIFISNCKLMERRTFTSNDGQVETSCYLKAFDKGNNGYQFELPKMLNDFKSLKNIEIINMTIISENFDISFINEFNQLKELNVWGGDEYTITQIDTLDNLQSLKILSINNFATNINNVNFVKNFPNLKELIIFSSIDYTIENIDALSYLQNLEALGLSKVFIENKHITLINNLVNLKELSLGMFCIDENVEDIEHIFNLPHLQELMLYINDVKIDLEKVISFLPNLTYLELDTSFDIDLNLLSNLYNLESLTLISPRILNFQALLKLSNLNYLIFPEYKNDFNIIPLSESNTIKEITIYLHYPYPDDPIPVDIFKNNGIVINEIYHGIIGK